MYVILGGIPKMKLVQVNMQRSYLDHLGRYVALSPRAVWQNADLVEWGAA